MFEFFDKTEAFRVTRGALPHRHQPGTTYFVTFRTEDSVPQALSRTWHANRAQWLLDHGIDPSAKDWKTRLRRLVQLEREYHSIFTRQFMEYLDRGLGQCVLRDQEIARIVADSLAHSDGENYNLADFVIMPNHIHLLVGLLGAREITELCESWKHFTALKINRRLNRRGRFWQAESFDYVVRSAEHFRRFQIYIADNPRKANLAPGTYFLRSLEAGTE
jgi:REP element-mobilizing transposase RayT